MSKSKDGVLKTLMVATLLCVVCSVLVSTAAVVLEDRQRKEKAFDKIRNVLQAAGLVGDAPTEEEVNSQRELLEMRAIEFATGEYVEVESDYDPRLAAADPELGVDVPSELDIAGIKRQAKRGLVFLIHRDGRLDQVVLPVEGMGLWGILYGFLAIRADLNTVSGLVFYEHKETPGLGAEVENPRWKAQWPGKKLFDEEGAIRAEVVKGVVDKTRPEATYQVDGLAGATFTTRGVTNMLRYWLGPAGYGPYLEKLRSEVAR